MDLTNIDIEERIRAAVAKEVTQRLEEIKVASNSEEHVNVGQERKGQFTTSTPMPQFEKEIKEEEEEADLSFAGELPKEEGTGPRNIVVCIDGTANQFGVQVRPS